MPQRITPEIFAHLEKLAALELSPEEAAYLLGELNGQLNAIEELEAIQVDPEVPITSHGVPYAAAISPSLREDRIELCEEADDILAQAPELDERYVVVPDIPQEQIS